ncbi:hypothetical protein ASPBRDRAFT_200302 [Aspergillus brasiliensis CBS 101740]|uniref:Zn(2)-C6 fungal-type domain-containing protein n=1 Tax=Aspergillus brasiliensis (strain CBS 101740 / IMI 381727 / IBT 21946) TaxID=767769 RepID=A0A1L9U630_ASPBC|nr:hypothetical protein ASPBRDRAFT_200302 [Aspergillus brasiliensis CBS 101740]
MRVRKNTCMQCRRRKVRCGGELTGCTNCMRLSFACSFVSNEQETADISTQCANVAKQPLRYTVGGTERRRGTPRLVSYEITRSPERRQTPPLPTPLTASPTTAAAVGSDTLWVRPVLEAHIDAFFEHVYPNPRFRFLHQSLFRRSFRHDKLDPLLLRCVCGITARFLHLGEHATALQYARDWLRHAESQVWSRLADMNVPNLQILVLLTYWHLMEHNTTMAWTMSAMVARIAYGIRLNHDDSSGRHGASFVAREANRRLMWSIFMLDKQYAGGFLELTLCPPETMYIQLPCGERSFELEIPVITSTLYPSEVSPDREKKVGLMGYMVRIFAIRHDILQKTRQIMSARKNPYAERDQLRRLETALDTFAAQLPDHLQLTSRNILLRAYTPHLMGYIVLHSTWHQLYCDLYRMMIPGLRESIHEDILQQVPEAYAASCRKICLDHVVAAGDLWSELLQQADPLTMTDSTFASYVHQSAHILAHLWDLDDGQDQQLRERFQVMIQVLDHLALLYPVVAKIQQDIQLLITELDRVIPMFHTQREQHPTLTLTQCWRTTLRQRGVRGGQTTSKFSMLSSVWDGTGSSSSSSTPSLFQPDNDDLTGVSISASTVGLSPVPIDAVDQRPMASSDWKRTGQWDVGLVSVSSGF